MLSWNISNPPRPAYVLSGVATDQGGAVNPAISERAADGVLRRRLHVPVCVFLIVFGVAKLAELLDWSRLHGDVVSMLGFGSGAVTGLLIAGKSVELLLTAVAALALARRNGTWLLAAVAGWTADLLVLTIVAVVYGDLGRMLEHGLSFLAFAALATATYVFGGVRPRRSPVAQATHQDLPVPVPEAEVVPEAKVVPEADVTRQDLPVRGADTTRMDLPVRRPDVTRQDMPVQGRRTWPPEDDRP
jgi:hypothetical protein